ncbi:MAG: MFS transporter [Anaerolineales bacterium]
MPDQSPFHCFKQRTENIHSQPSNWFSQEILLLRRLLGIYFPVRQFKDGRLLLGLCIMIQSDFTPAALAYLADMTETHKSDRGAILGLYSVFLGLGHLLGAIINRIFIDWRGADGMVLIIGSLCIFAAFQIFRMRSSESPNKEIRH